MNIKHFILGLAAVVGLSLASATNAASEHSLPAVQGYDVVSYQTLKRPIRGTGHFTAEHNGATYLFSSEANLNTFKADPEKYAPAYNGYCAFGVSVGKKFIADPEVWRVVDGRLYLNLDANIQDAWLEDVPGRIVTADKEWKRIEHKAAHKL